MDKYFEFKYWLEIIGLIVGGLVMLIIIICFIIDAIKSNYKRKSKKWKQNYFTGKWEKVDKND